MTILRSPLPVAVVFLCLSVSTAAEPDADDPLPKGAKLRLGSNRLNYRYSPSAVLLPPDYKTFLVPDVSRGFRRFDAVTGKALDEAKDVVNPGGQVILSADGKRAVGVHTGLLTVRDIATGKPVGALKPPNGFGTFSTTTAPHVSLSGDGKLAAQGVTNLKTSKGEVLLWDVDKSKVLAQLETIHKGGVLPVLSTDGKLLATRGTTTTPFVPPGGKEDDTGRTIQVWDVAEKKEVFKALVSPGGFQITACVFSPDATLLAASCAEGPIELWDVKTQKLRATLLGRAGQGLRIAFSPDVKTLAAVATDGAVQRWATGDGKALTTTEPPPEMPFHAAHGLAFADNDRVVVWGAAGTCAIAWESPSGKYIRAPGTHTSGIKSIAFAEGGKHILTAGLDGHLVKWDAATGKLLGTLTLRPSRSSAHPPRFVVNLAPDATRGISIGNPAAVFDLTTGMELFTVPRGTPVGFTTFTIAAGNVSHAITCSVPFDSKKQPNGSLAVWDLTARKLIARLELPITSGQTPVAALSPSGTRLVVARYAKSANANRVVLIVTGFDLKTGKPLDEAEDHEANGALSVTAASETNAIVSSGGSRLRLFDYEAGRARDVIETTARGEPGAPVVFSPDGKRFAFGVSTDKPDEYGIRIYDWPSTKALHTFVGHRAPITAITFTADGKTLATGANDTTVLLWDLTTLPAPK